MISSSLPLKKKKVLVPRGKKHAKPFSDLVESYGGVPVEIPLLAFRPIEPTKDLQHTFDSLHTYDWIIFTSNVTVETFFAIYKGNTLPKIAAIGDKTEQALGRRGMDVHFKPNKFVAESFVEEFIPHVTKGTRILIPKGNLAREYISTSLQEVGGEVDELIIYETYFPKESEELLVHVLSEKALDIITFTSPSTVDHFLKVVKQYKLHENIKGCIVTCIGPVTKKRAEALGLTVHAMPSIYTVHEMIKSVILYLSEIQNSNSEQ
ncbi:uroporphyrinogen-III synthase [Cytobacillus sp. FJAT-54145]|uniref:Uroporphyrinogen-III synthase n=1 Tax=Cytobacillus spartinae TaxID=3299023 RepID=A0ABW6KGW0_9BACI